MPRPKRQSHIQRVSITLGYDDSPYTTEIVMWPRVNQAQVIERSPMRPDEVVGGTLTIDSLMEALERISGKKRS